MPHEHIEVGDVVDVSFRARGVHMTTLEHVEVVAVPDAQQQEFTVKDEEGTLTCIGRSSLVCISAHP